LAVRKTRRGVDAPDPEGPAREDRVGAGMGRWRREFPDIDCSGKAVVGRLLHLRETMLVEINRTLARHGLKYPEFAVLATLRVEGSPFRMTPKELLDALILTSGGLSNLVRRLEAAGHVRRLPDARDGRGVIVELTAAGRRRVEPAMRDHAATERRLIAALDERTCADLARGLAQLMPAPRRTRRRADAG
jgi:DNA-binding MarR family transcriptional regulator